MKVIIWLLLIFVMLNWLFRIFRKEIMLYIAKSIAKKVGKSVEEQQKQYQRQHEPGYFHESVFQDENLHITAPKTKSKKEVKVDDIAEDADFEEIK